MRKIVFIAISMMLCSCVSSKVTILSEPSTAAIYVDDIYQGNGIVQYEIPKGQKYIEISCSEDGVNFARRRFFVRSMDRTISFRISEYMQYSSGAPTF